jgi:hypothetical protein
VVIGERAGEEVSVDLAGHGALGILGAGAEGLARAAVVGLLAAGGPAAVEVLLVGNQLIPGAIGVPGLRRAATLAGALHVVEAELVQRARLLETEDTPDFSAHRREHPDDPLPALVLVADSVSLEQAGRLAAILAQGPAWESERCCPVPEPRNRIPAAAIRRLFRSWSYLIALEAMSSPNHLACS